MRKILSLIILLAISSMLSFGQNLKVNLKTSDSQKVKADEAQNLEQYFSKNVTSNAKVVLLNEGFESTTFPPTGWTVQNLTANTALQWKSDVIEHSGSKNATVDSYVPSTEERNEWLISPSLDLTTITNPCLKFWIDMSYYWSISPNDNYDFRVNVSTNGGTNWTTIWTEDSVGEVFDSWFYYLRWVPLTNYATSTNFKVAFQYVGRIGTGQAAAYLDDISIESTPNNNITVDRMTLHDGYMQIPQGLGRSMFYETDISNFGGMTQNHIRLHGVELTTGADSTSVDTTLAPGKSIKELETIDYFFTPSATASAGTTYKVTSYISTDSIPYLAQDTFDVKIVCDTCVYSRDNNTYSGWIWQGATNGLCDPYTAANRYQVNQDRMAYGIQCVLGATSKPGSKIKAVLYKHFAATGTRQIVAQSANYFITAADVPPHVFAVNPVSVSLPFVAGTPAVPTGYTMQKDSLYLVGIQVFGQTDTVKMATDNTGIPQWEQTSLYYDPSQSSWFVWDNGNTTAKMIRTVFNQNYHWNSVVGINEISNNNISLFSCMPNPANNTTQISYELKNSEKATIIITDITGRTVKTMNQGTQVKGNYTIDVDLSDLTSGTYFYTLKTATAQATDKLIVVKR